MRSPSVELEDFQLCCSEEKLNHVLKIDSDKLFKDLLTNKIFPRQILSWNFKIGTGMGIPRLEINNSNSLFL